MVVNTGGPVYQNSGFSGSPVGAPARAIATSSAALIKRGYSDGYVDQIAGAAFDMGGTMGTFLTEGPTDVNIFNEALERGILQLRDL